jgi:hypothetical protein
MRKTELADETLCEAVLEMSNGLIDADLGGNIVKKRISVGGQGKRGGARTLLATNKDDRWFFVFGFQKNTRSNISAKEKNALQQLAIDLLALTETQLDFGLHDGVIEEICHDN